MKEVLRGVDSIYGAEVLHIVKDKICLWDFNKLNGIGYFEGHDKYCFFEITIYEYSSYPDKDNKGGYNSSFLDWNVDNEIFPEKMYQAYKKGIFKYANFANAFFTALIGREINLVFEITFSGYHITYHWGEHIAGRALLNAIVSCFDENLYKKGLEHKKTYYNKERFESLRRWAIEINKTYSERGLE